MPRLIKLLTVIGMLSLLSITWAVSVLHLGVIVPPKIDSAATKDVARPGIWIDKSRFGMHQLVLFGSPYERGLESGRLTKPLLFREEKELNDKLREFIPNPVAFIAFEVALMRWFWGIDAYLEPWMTEEMLGVSKSAPPEFDYIVDSFTRQIAYHGIHEVGQLSVDQGVEDMGCTVVALPYGSAWVIGRNFDFDASRIFDTEKVLKWVFPDQGYAFVSVIWAGMVGGVTGVNENGVYLSINAAGSTDFRRLGTPSTLVWLKAIQNAKTVDDAVQIIRNETMFITDIFVATDKSGKAYRIEKSPDRTEVSPLSGPTIIANHLISDVWKEDGFNSYRRDELTSAQRQQRGENLLKNFSRVSRQSADKVEQFALSVLRDKGESDGEPLFLGNRQAIDSLIASHSVIYNAADQIFYVSQGPSVSGPFTGFDLRASFATKTPVATGALPRDPSVSDADYENVRVSEREVAKAQRLLKAKQCDQAWMSLEVAREHTTNSSGFYATLGDYYDCKGNKALAREAWRNALALSPAYPRQVRSLKEKLK